MIWLVPSLVGGAVAVAGVGLLLGPMYPILMNESAKLMTDHVPASLHFSNISYMLGGRTILDNISGSAKPGQLLAIMGASGAGKSTFLDILARKSKRGTVSGTTGSVSAALHAPPPSSGPASTTSTDSPAPDSTTAAARPFGPEPTTTASTAVRPSSGSPMPRRYARPPTARPRPDRARPGPRAPTGGTLPGSTRLDPARPAPPPPPAWAP